MNNHYAHSGLLADLYELTMAAGYVETRFEARATFELFVRSLPSRRNCLVAAGLEQALEFLENVRFAPEEICPAPGQGALALETRSPSHPATQQPDEARDAYIRNAIAFLEHPHTRFAIDAERTTLDALGGGCSLPIGVHCIPPATEAGKWRMLAQVVSPDGETMIQIDTEATYETPSCTLGRWVADDLISKGALDLLPALNTA